MKFGVPFAAVFLFLAWIWLTYVPPYRRMLKNSPPRRDIIHDELENWDRYLSVNAGRLSSLS